MLKKLLRTEAVLEECEEHLQKTNSFGTSIESYLTQHVLVVLCADMQGALSEIVKHRLQNLGDQMIVTYIQLTLTNIVRSVNFGDINKFVGKFGDDKKEFLRNSVNDKDITLYNNAVADRHRVAHYQGATVSFDELKGALISARKILDAVEQSLS